MFAYFKDLDAKGCVPTLEDLYEDAAKLHERYTTRRACRAVELGHEQSLATLRLPTAHAPVHGPGSSHQEAPSDSAAAGPKCNNTGDRVLAQSMLFMMDSLLSRVVAQAGAEGDVGAMYEGLKVRSQQSLIRIDTHVYC